MRLLDYSNPETKKVTKYIISSIVESNIKYVANSEDEQERITLLKKSSDDVSIFFFEDNIYITAKLSVYAYKGLITDLLIIQKQVMEEIRLFTGLICEGVNLQIEKCMLMAGEKRKDA